MQKPNDDQLDYSTQDKVDIAEGEITALVYETLVDDAGVPILDADGRTQDVLVQQLDKKNLIVKGARTILAYLLGSADPQYAIDVFKLGKNGHLGTDILQAVPPSVSDTDLIDSSPFTKLYSDLGSCSINPDQNITALACTGAGGTWTPDTASAIQYLPAVEPNSVQFTMTIHKIEANGTGVVPYTEAGLFAVNGTEFSRITFPALVKTPERKIVFQWRILF